jgi:hypothetical protein
MKISSRIFKSSKAYGPHMKQNNGFGTAKTAEIFVVWIISMAIS